MSTVELAVQTFGITYAEVLKATNLPGEEWRPVPEWDLYEVSNLGRVRRVAPGFGTQIGRVLKPQWGKKGYAFVTLHQGELVRQKRVQRLVCAAFNGPAPDADSEANHINGDKSDNRADNLEWNTPVQNLQHSWRTGLHKNTKKGTGHPYAKLTEDQVREIKGLLGSMTGQAIADKYGVSAGAIYDIAAGRNWKHVQAAPSSTASK